MRETIKVTAVLLIICIITAGLLAGANELTKGPIADSRANAEKEALKEVMADVDTEALQDAEVQKIAETLGSESMALQAVFKATKDGEDAGYIFKTSNNGFGGPVVVLTAIDMDGNITGAKVTQNSETAGLGANAANTGEDAWINQFQGKNIQENELEVIKNATPNDQQILAITGSTITSKCVTKSVNMARTLFLELAGGAK